MSNPQAAHTLRAKMLGVLLTEARMAARKTGAECAEAMGCPPEVYDAYEAGKKSPSLPELELLAYYLDVPPAHFWGERTLEEVRPAAPPPAAVTRLRDRIIGAQLRQARLATKAKLKAVADAAGISTGKLTAYEAGEKSAPLPELEALVAGLGLSLEDLLEAHGQVGDWESTHRAVERFRQFAPDLREFVSQPANETYLRLAQRISQMPTDQLRSLAEGLLELTY